LYALRNTNSDLKKKKKKNNVHIKEGDKWKVAFKTSEGLFEPTVMFFSLTNSLATFQTMMDEIFQEEMA
jgi:hypothetical protein